MIFLPFEFHFDANSSFKTVCAQTTKITFHSGEGYSQCKLIFSTIDPQKISSRVALRVLEWLHWCMVSHSHIFCIILSSKRFRKEGEWIFKLLHHQKSHYRIIWTDWKDIFFKYKAFTDELKFYVISRPVKPLIKVNDRKSFVKDDALQLIKSFHQAEQSTDALEALENAY